MNSSNEYDYEAAAFALELEHQQLDEFLNRPLWANWSNEMNINDIYAGKYLRAGDLQGHTVKVTIDRVVIENLGKDGKNEPKPIVYFVGKNKGLAMNKTNAMIIGSAYGPDTDAWKGKEIELRPDKTMFQGQPTDCLRVQIPAPPPPSGSGGMTF